MFRWSPSCACCANVPTCLNCQTCAPPSCILISFDYPSVTLSGRTATNCGTSTAHVSLTLASDQCSWTGSFSSDPVGAFFTTGGYSSNPCGWFAAGQPAISFLDGWFTVATITVSCTAAFGSKVNGYLQYRIDWKGTTFGTGFYWGISAVGLLAPHTCSPFVYYPESRTGQISNTNASFSTLPGYLTPSGGSCSCSISLPSGSWSSFAQNVSLAPCP